MDENFNDIFDAIREYVLEALKNPINSGYKAELVPELYQNSMGLHGVVAIYFLQTVRKRLDERRYVFRRFFGRIKVLRVSYCNFRYFNGGANRICIIYFNSLLSLYFQDYYSKNTTSCQILNMLTNI